MQRYRLAVFTFFIVLIAIAVVGLAGGYALLAFVEAQYVSLQRDGNRRRAEASARMVEQFLKSGASPREAVLRFQAAIEGTDGEPTFLCLIDQSGQLLSHPNPALIGISRAALHFELEGGQPPMTWAEAMLAGRPVSGLLSSGEEGHSQIVFCAPIAGTTWFAAAHARAAIIEQEVSRLARELTLVASVIALVMALAASVGARWVARQYERRIEEANARLEEKVGQRTAELQGVLADLRLAHERLVRGEKLNLLGELMSGIAHEIRTPLSSIVFASHDLERHPGDERHVQETAGLLRQAADRLTSIVENMLAFVRSQPPSRTEQELNNVCLSAIELIASDLQKDRVELRTDLAPELPPLRLDRQQIQQVILNLLNNARQALRDWPGERVVVLKTGQRNESVTLDVKDTGPGIPEALEESVFQPFFTTKETGTGLGLALCRRFMEAHQGTLRLIPAERGAHFRATFPVEAS